MFIPRLHRPNAFAYLFWRWAGKKYGKFSAYQDAYFFGPSHGINDYDSLSRYKESHVKPDKQYSILPTVLQLAGTVQDKIVVDLGCGTGFFTIPLAEHGAYVYGIDNSKAQLTLAPSHPRIIYCLRDIFVDSLPMVHVFIAPFVVNYARTVPILRHFFQTLYKSLAEDGQAVFVVDLPNGKQLRRFGAMKRIVGKERDGAKLCIELFNDQEKICELSAFYFTPETIERELRAVGFKEIRWHTPIVSDEGVQALGTDFWNGYVEDSELGYLTAQK